MQPGAGAFTPAWAPTKMSRLRGCAALVTWESWGQLSHLASLDQLGTLGLGLTGGRHVGDAHQLEQGLALLHMLLTHLTGNNRVKYPSIYCTKFTGATGNYFLSLVVHQLPVVSNGDFTKDLVTKEVLQFFPFCFLFSGSKLQWYVLSSDPIFFFTNLDLTQI